MRRDSLAPKFRLMAVHSTGTLTLLETTVSGGLSGIRPVGGIGYAGGGVANYGGRLTVRNSTISNNDAWEYGHGGGVANAGGGTVLITNSTLYSNASADGSCGGVRNSGIMTITTSTLAGNVSEYDGGGVCNLGIMTITTSTLTGNKDYGG